MNKRSLKTQTLIRITLVLVILILLNIVSVRVFGRLDVTEQGIFTLSEASRNLVASLDDRITIKAYLTEDLPSPYNNHRRAVLDQLNEYKAYSHGNLQYEFINPAGEEGERDAQQQGIAPVQVQVVKEDKFEAKRAYLGLVFLYEDRKETIPVVRNMTTLEYDISATIKRLVTKTRKKVGFLSGHGEPGLDELAGVQSQIGKQYDLSVVDLSGGKPVPSDISALVIMAPKSPIPPPHQYQIDQFLMRGGKVGFLLNRVDADLQQRFGRELNLGLEDMLSTYGLKINADLVRDTRCANVSIVQQSFGFTIQSQVPFPLLPLAGTFNRENMMVKDLKGMVFFFVSSIDTVGIGAKKLAAEILVRTSSESGRQKNVFMINPLSEYTPAEFAEQEIPLAAVVGGVFKSAFAEKEIPIDTTAGAEPPSGEKLTSSLNTQVILVGDGDFARDRYLGNNDNLKFFANMIDYLLDDAGLITIRSKDITLPPLEQVSDGVKDLVKYGNLALPPLLVLGYGLIRWRVRKARRKALEAK
jgi:gliding-associated putative ABC transporter substrate-binding component GldG